MTSIHIVEHLAREFSIDALHVRNALEMIDAGLTAPFIGRVRRAESGGLSEGQVRRLLRRRADLDELDRRRGTILRMLGAEPSGEGEIGEPKPGEGAVVRASADVIERVRSCMDRFELEDLFLPHRRPEPEVQLALDRGLGRLADVLVEPVPPERRAPAPSEAGAGVASALEAPADEAAADETAADEAAADEAGPDGGSSSETSEAAAAEPEQPQPDTSAASAAADTAAPHDADQAAASSGPDGGDAPASDAPAPDAPAPDAGPTAGAPRAGDAAASGPKPVGPGAALSSEEEALLHGQVELTPSLARLCAPFVSPDRGVHTETEALSGAMRILADRLGRDTRLRGTLRRMLRKQGVLSVRPVVEESKLGRHRSLLRLRQPLKQVQGHRLLAVRQAQKERVVQAVIALDRVAALPKVRATLGRHTDPELASVLDAVALRALEYRLLPLLEADVRLELKERADEEALRFLSQHLRQVLLAPGVGLQPVAGVDVNAKGGWTLALLDERGELQGETVRVETGEKELAALGEELAAALCEGGEGGEGGEGARRPRVRALGVGHGKQARAAVSKLRAALAAAGLDLIVLVVNEAGLSSYASSERARRELSELQVPQRMAVSLGRRLQDPLAEIVKVDARHLGLGSEQGLVSKANLRRAMEETEESCVALVGCDLNRAPVALLARMPGLGEDDARRLIERRVQRPFESREELRAEGLLSEVQWANAAAFLRVRGPERLDGTGLHPEQYELARRLIEATGGTVEDSLGRPGVTKGLRRVDFGVEEHTWRDLMRELSWPGRDPRPGLFPPQLLDPATDRVTLTRDRVVEGIVSNVTSFGAFVDLGLDQDGMVHVSEISDRYVRDARELVSVGQTVRARILDGSTPRVSLSLKGLAPPGRGAGRGGARGRGGERGARGEHRGRVERHAEPSVPVRAAQSRRDGLVTGRGGSGRPGDRGRGRTGGGRGGGRGGGPGRGPRRDRDEAVRPEDLRAAASPKVAYNPFAAFFKEAQPEGESEAEKPDSGES